MNAVVNRLNAEVLCEHVETCLGCRIGEGLSSDPGDLRVHRADVDDGALRAVLNHVLHREVREVCGRVEVEVNLALPVLEGHLLEAALGHLERAACVVDEDVDRAELLKEVVHHLLDNLALRDVAAENLGADAVLAALLRNHLRCLGVLVVGDTYIVTPLCESDDGSCTDTGRRAGDQYISCHCVFLQSVIYLSFLVSPKNFSYASRAAPSADWYLPSVVMETLMFSSRSRGRMLRISSSVRR